MTVSNRLATWCTQSTLPTISTAKRTDRPRTENNENNVTTIQTKYSILYVLFSFFSHSHMPHLYATLYMPCYVASVLNVITASQRQKKKSDFLKTLSKKLKKRKKILLKKFGTTCYKYHLFVFIVAGCCNIFRFVAVLRYFIFFLSLV